MYMPDAIRGTIELMQADASKISIRSAYNFSALDFTPLELADSIRKYIPDFVLSFDPDFRQAIADTWPQTVNDQQARNDWGWSPQFNLDNMTKSMLEVLSHKIKKDILVQ
jgi:nucleoside-diphosphate-sugar epimerase